MVLDIVELLQHEARYDEFIVFSADADFTPVLRKLRRWDRRTTVLAIGFPSAAYRASADLLIDQDDFVRNALGNDDDAEVRPTPPELNIPPSEAAENAFRLMRQTVAESQGPVPLSRLAALILSKVDGMDASSWAGFGSFRGLLESKGVLPLEVCWDGGGYVRDPKRHAASAPARRQTGADRDTLVDAATNLVKSEVANARQPIQCGALANLIIQRHPQLAADWNGKGTFRKFAESLDVLPAVFDWSVSGGLASDPSRVPAVPQSQEDWGDARQLYSAARMIHEVTGTPLLPPTKYQVLFRFIEADSVAHPFHLMETGKRVRDLCKAAGTPISRSDINYVLRGLLFRGHSFDDGPNNAAILGRRLVDNVKSLCLREQMELDEVNVAAIESWLVGSRS
ncbi:NYN domain protein [compost metagenome]